MVCWDFHSFPSHLTSWFSTQVSDHGPSPPSVLTFPHFFYCISASFSVALSLCMLAVGHLYSLHSGMF